MKDELVEIVARYLCEWAGWQPEEKLQGDNLPTLGWMTFRKDARELLRAIEGAGMKVVGREATEEMIEAATEMALDDYHQFDDIDFGKVLAAAFDAAPAFGGGE